MYEISHANTLVKFYFINFFKLLKNRLKPMEEIAVGI